MNTESVLYCPNCKNHLYPTTWKNIQLDICSKGCSGIWFDYQELNAVEQSDSTENIDAAFEGTYEKQPILPALEDVSERICPKDNTNMERYEWNVGSGIVMDSCPQCNGIWLDSGELEGFASYVHKFSENPPKPTPAIQAQIKMINQQAKDTYENILDEATSTVVRWDFLQLDDVIRFLVKNIIRE